VRQEASRFRPSRKSALPLTVNVVPEFKIDQEKADEGIQTENWDVEAQQKRGRKKLSRSIRAVQTPDQLLGVPELPDVATPLLQEQPKPNNEGSNQRSQRERLSTLSAMKGSRAQRDGNQVSRQTVRLITDGTEAHFVDFHVKPNQVTNGIHVGPVGQRQRQVGVEKVDEKVGDDIPVSKY